MKNQVYVYIKIAEYGQLSGIGGNEEDLLWYTMFGLIGCSSSVGHEESCGYLSYITESPSIVGFVSVVGRVG